MNKLFGSSNEPSTQIQFLLIKSKPNIQYIQFQSNIYNRNKTQKLDRNHNVLKARNEDFTSRDEIEELEKASVSRLEPVQPQEITSQFRSKAKRLTTLVAEKFVPPTTDGTGHQRSASFKHSITQINFCSVRSIDKRGMQDIPPPSPSLFGLGPDVRSGYFVAREHSAYIFLRRKHGNRVSMVGSSRCRHLRCSISNRE